MTIQQLICRAASAFPDSFVLNYFDLATGKPRQNPRGGDTLARFIAFELAETFDKNACDAEQIATAVKAMIRASDELAEVAHAVSDMAGEERRAA